MAGLANSMRETGLATVVCLGMHPSEIQDPDGSLNGGSVEMLEGALDMIRETLSPLFMDFDGAVSADVGLT